MVLYKRTVTIVGKGVIMKYYLAIDMGASSGRHIVGYLKDGQIALDEVYRFGNGMDKVDGHLVWDTERLWSEIKTGIKLALNKYPQIESVAIDTWGVDYVLLKGDQTVLPHYAYRDGRTADAITQVHAIVPFDELYRWTGIQFQTFNTIYQLYADKLSGRLDGVTDFLMLPEYFTYRLTGIKMKEYTDASTGGFVNVDTKQFDKTILNKLGLPMNIFSTLHPAGTLVGYLSDDVAKEVGGQTKVILCASHDTASAFEAVDCPDNSVIISSGTWSLIGTKIKQASTSKQSQQSNFANEGGVGYFRYLKNIMGMWLVNEVQRKYNLPITEIVQLAEQSTYNQIFDVNDESLTAPADMEIAIRNLLDKKGKPLPQSIGDVFASIYHSLAYSYKLATDNMQSNLGITFDSIYIVGGGAKNKFLNSLTERYTCKKVVALPIEATAIGNIKIQMKQND